ncbi:MAG: PIN domain-containing protein [Nitrospirae bacterium]|nr:MAG: PIN domain-containing protein [Nitrospirota bacterium]
MIESISFVLDASVTLSWLFEDEITEYTETVLEALTESTAIVPSIWPLEVGNALLVAERRKRLSHADTVSFLRMLSELPIRVEYQSMDIAIGEIIELARSENLSTYDSSYLHLAMHLGLPIATKDKALQKAARRCGVKIFGLQ